jgi:hypothetical protein
MTITEQWEYCFLYLGAFYQRDNDVKNTRGWICDLRIDFMGVETIGETLCTSKYIKDESDNVYYEFWPGNPWTAAIGMMGSFGWELVSIHSSDGLVAYFKRPRKFGRAVNEPKFAFVFQPERLY